MTEQEKRRDAAIQILARMDIYAEEQFGTEFNALNLARQLDIIEAMLHSGVITKSGVTYM